MTFAVDWALETNCLSICFTLIWPFAVDWALETNCLSIYLFHPDMTLRGWLGVKNQLSIIYIYFTLIWTFAVDWALKTNCLYLFVSPWYDLSRLTGRKTSSIFLSLRSGTVEFYLYAERLRLYKSSSHKSRVERRSAGKQKDAGSTPRFGSPFSSKIVIYGHCLGILPCTINETLKWLTSLPVLMRKSFWCYRFCELTTTTITCAASA